MTTKDLFRCIGNLSDGMIEEAADIRRNSEFTLTIPTRKVLFRSSYGIWE